MADYSNGAYIHSLESEYADQILGDYLCALLNPFDVMTGLGPLFPQDTSIGLDTIRTGGIAFYYPTKAGATDSVTFDTQWIPLRPRYELLQNILKAKSGKLSVYDSPANRILQVYIGRNVPMEQRQRMFIFYANICKGALYTFQYEDDTGVIYTCRFSGKNCNWEMHHWLKWDITINCYVESIDYVPPT